MKKLVEFLAVLVLLVGISSCVPSTDAEQIVTFFSSEDSCTSGLLFSWHMENGTVTSGSPPGCSVGDTTASYASLGALNTDVFYDGSTSLDIPTDGDFAYFTVSSNDIFNPASGTITFWAYFDSLVNNTRLFSTGPDSTNYFRVYLTSTDEMAAVWNGNSTTTSIVTTDANIPATTWVEVTVKYTIADVNPNLSVVITGYGTAATSNTNLTALVGTNDTMIVGNSGAGTGDLHLDNLQVHNTWL